MTEHILTGCCNITSIDAECAEHSKIPYVFNVMKSSTSSPCDKQMVKDCCIIDLNINCRACWECWWMAHNRVKEKQWPSVSSFTPSCPPRCYQITLFYPIKAAGWASSRLPFFAHLNSCDFIVLSLGEMSVSGWFWHGRGLPQTLPFSLRLM